MGYGLGFQALGRARRQNASISRRSGFEDRDEKTDRSLLRVSYVGLSPMTNRPHKPVTYSGDTYFTKNKRFTDKRKREFVEELRKLGRETMARVKVGVSAATVLRHKNDDPEFAASCEEAHRLFCEEQIDGEMHRRGIEGVQEAVYGKDANGNTSIIGWVTKYSDRMLSEYARRHMPSEYGTDRSVVEQRTHVTGEVKATIGLDQLSKESRADLRAILQREANDGRDDGTTEAE